MKPLQLIAPLATLSVAISPPQSRSMNSTIDTTINSNMLASHDTTTPFGNQHDHTLQQQRSQWHIMWAWQMESGFFPQTFTLLVDDFCISVEGKGHIRRDTWLSDTYLVKPDSARRAVCFGDMPAKSSETSKIAIKNNGERPACHIKYWVDDCATQLRALLDTDCHGAKDGDTRGRTNTIGNIVFEATLKKGDTW